MSENKKDSPRRRRADADENTPISQSVRRKRERKSAKSVDPEVLTSEAVGEPETQRAVETYPVRAFSEHPSYSVPALWENPALLDEKNAKDLLNASAQAAIKHGYAADGNLTTRGKLTPMLLQSICYGVEQGMSLQSIVDHLGIPYVTLQDWRRKGKDENSGIYHYLVRGIAAAQARFEIQLVKIIQDAAHGRHSLREVKTKFKRVWIPPTTVDGDDGRYEMVAEERTEVAKEVAPSSLAAQFLLERRMPRRYGAWAQEDEDPTLAAERLDSELDLIDELTNPAPNASEVVHE